MVEQSNKSKCLYCYESINETDQSEYHAKCSVKLFGAKTPPILPYNLSMINELASQEINKRLSITGVQPKISLGLEKGKDSTRLTIVGLWGEYIFKPPFTNYPEMPEIEDMTMHLAEIAGIQTSLHGLIRFQSGELGYITKRFDRDKSKKIHTEDFCQLTETMTVNKYNSSMEKIGRTIQQYSEYSGLDKLRFFEISLFCYITGNADMHLKNFSLYRSKFGELTLSPAYDLIASKLLIPQDKEESALTINGKKSNLRKKDFGALAQNLNIDEKAVSSVFRNLSSKIEPMMEFLNKGFISKETTTVYRKLITGRVKKLGLS
ncbi:MAG: HipA domain-containing protein [Ignavibacteria bacterium]|nr:HipA domain-containing protein [Ignavibacteria bacterium]